MMQSALEELPLLDYLEYDVVEFRRIVRGLNRKARIFEVSCKTGQGMDSWCVWLARPLHPYAARVQTV